MALVMEKDGIAGKTLRQLGSQKMMSMTRSSASQDMEPLMPPVKLSDSYLPYSPKGKEILAFAGDEAKRRALKIGTEHSAGTIGEDDILAARILQNLGLSPLKTRQMVFKEMGIADTAAKRRPMVTWRRSPRRSGDTDA